MIRLYFEFKALPSFILFSVWFTFKQSQSTRECSSVWLLQLVAFVTFLFKVYDFSYVTSLAATPSILPIQKHTTSIALFTKHRIIAFRHHIETVYLCIWMFVCIVHVRYWSMHQNCCDFFPTQMNEKHMMVKWDWSAFVWYFFPEFCPSILIISYFNSFLDELHKRSVYAWSYKYKCNAVYLQNSKCEIKKTPLLGYAQSQFAS